MKVNTEIYSLLCDVVERAWQHWPVDLQPDEVDTFHTSSYARSAAMRIVKALEKASDKAKIKPAIRRVGTRNRTK